jgi:hypothetical protein
VVISFVNGTARQQDLFNRAMAVSTFPWSRIESHVSVEWVDEVELNRDHHAFAAVEAREGLDACGRTDQCYMQIRNDLDDPFRPGNDGGWPKGHFRGDKFYMETVNHELGHVVQFKLNPSQRAKRCHAFGASTGQWDDVTLPWEMLVQEADAETFKDVFLPRRWRKFDNRTTRRLRRERFEEWMSVLDDLCPCGPRRCIESGVTYVERNDPPGIKPPGVHWDPSFVPGEDDTAHLLGPDYTADRWPAVQVGDERWLRIRWGRDDSASDLIQMPIPTYELTGPAGAEILYSIDFYFYPTDAVFGMLLNEWVGDEHWWWAGREETSPGSGIFGVWHVANDGRPVTKDDMSLLFDYNPFLDWWFQASLRLCTTAIIS